MTLPRCTLCREVTPGPRQYSGLIQGVVHEKCSEELETMIRDMGFETIQKRLAAARGVATVTQSVPAANGGQALWYWA